MFPTGLTPTLTHAECIERMAVSRIFLPELRVMCRAYRGEDVIDRAGRLRPGWSV